MEFIFTSAGGHSSLYKNYRMEDSTPSHYKIDVLPAPESRRQCRHTGLGACTKNIKMTDTPPSDQETWSDNEIDVLPVPEPRRRPDEPYLVEQMAVTPFSRRLIRQYNGRKAREFAYRVDLTDRILCGLDLVRDERRLYDLWSCLLKHMRRDENVGDEDLVRFHFNHPSLTSGNIKVNLQRFADLTSETIRRRLSDVAQSKKGLHLDNNLDIMMGVIQFPRGGRRLTADNVTKSRCAGEVSRDSIITAWRWHSAFAGNGRNWMPVSLTNKPFTTTNVRRPNI